jgi:putative membrane protein
MIVPRSAQVLRMVQYVGKPLLLLAVYDVIVVVAYQVMRWEWVALPHIPLALYGSAIGVILGFRNQSSYARWWEARTLWGSIVNNSRSWARQAIASLRAEGEGDAAELKTMRRRLVYHQIAYVHALRQHLRRLEPWEELSPLLKEAELSSLREEKNVPLALQQQMGALLQECRERGWVDGWQWQAMDESLNDLADAQGGTERIKNTPMPKQYDYFPQLFVHIYCMLLPLALVTNMGWFTPLGSTLVGFIFLALDKIGRDLEDPFENTIYDVPLTSITRAIEVNLRQLLGETSLPQPEAAVHGVLW